MANLQCNPAANILPYQADVSGSGDNIPTTNFLRIAYGTVSGGPYPFFSTSDPGTNSVGQVINKTLTDLSPNTTYYYVVQEWDGTNVVETEATECSFTTGGYNPQCTVNFVQPNALPAFADVTITADNVPPNLELKIKWGTTPGGPYPNTQVSVPGNNTVGQTLNYQWPLVGCTDYYWVAEVSEPDGFLYSPNQLPNGDMESSTGVGATSSIGPGWNTDYAPCGPNLFAFPCSAGNYAFFTTNSGQVMGGGNFPVLGTRSFGVNVSSTLTDRIIYWDNIFLENGRTYRLHGDAGCDNPPFAIDIRIDGNVIAPLTPGGGCGSNIWGSTDTDFVWTGATGLHTVSLNSGSTVFGGNDHVLDNITLQLQEPPAQSGECVIDSTATVCLPATNIGQESATLNSLTCSIFGGTFTSFVYDTDPGGLNVEDYSFETVPVLQPINNNGQNISQGINNLDCGTTYYFRSVSRDADFNIVSISVDECSFTTLPCVTWCGGFWDPANCIPVDINGDGETDYVNCWPEPVRDGFPGEGIGHADL